MTFARAVLAALILFGTAGVVGQANPVPFINQPLVPSSVAPGGPAFTLTVNGTGFVSGATVNWNGSSRQTIFVSSAQLIATISSLDIVNAETASITVTNPAGATSTALFLPISLPTASVSFSRSDVATDAGCQGVVAADFNGDGKLDLALSVFVKDGEQILILPGNGDGTFASPKFHMPSGQGFPVAADFNGDGKMDLAVAATSNEILVYLGNGDGTFGPGIQARTTNPTNGRLVAADFNGDGRTDLAVTFGGAESGAISVFLGKGDGTFEPEQLYSTTWTLLPLAGGDFNGDGALDLVAGGWDLSGNSTLLFYFGNGDGTFRPQTSIAIKGLGTFTVADFNGDGKLDIVAATSGLNLLVLFGNGDGTFGSAKHYRSLSDPAWLATGDFNADGYLDIVSVNQGANNVTVLLAHGDGTFPFSVGKTPNAFAIGDFNGDGRLDLAVGNFVSSFFTILLQTAP